jgi:hypothetical protein
MKPLILFLAVLCLSTNLQAKSEKAVNLLDGISMQTQHYTQTIKAKPLAITKFGWREGYCQWCQKQNIVSHYIELANWGCAVCDFSTGTQCQCERGHYWYQKYMTNGTVQVERFKLSKRILPDTRQWAALHREPVTIVLPTDPLPDLKLPRREKETDTLSLISSASAEEITVRPPTIRYILFRRGE